MNFIEYLLTLQIQMTYLKLDTPESKAKGDELLKDMYEQIELKDNHESEHDGEMEINSSTKDTSNNSIKDRLFKL